jgi:uncharacterized protein (TIGR00251 family)
MVAQRLTIRVKPGSSRNRVGGSYGDEPALIVAVTAPAVDGKANDAVIDAVAKALGLKSRQIGIHSGHTSRTKILTIDMEETEADQFRLELTRLLAL